MLKRVGAALWGAPRTRLRVAPARQAAKQLQLSRDI
jgi:hypothetical protein